MSVLDVAHLSHSYGGREIFDDVSFRLEKGEHVALIGANGEGKSTFMAIITGKLSPDEGKVTWARRTKVGYLDQHSVLEPGKTIRETLRMAFQDLVEQEQEMLADYDKMESASPEEMDRLMAEVGEIQERLEAAEYYNLDSKIEEVAGGLGLRDIGLEHRVDELSGGQRTKVLLTKLLLENSDILLLDEPTNYLDVEHIQWLTRYLQEYENAFILISHDVPFLNAVTNVIWHVDNFKLTRYTGNYEKFQEMAATKRRQEEAAYERQQAEIKKEMDFIARNKARVATRGMANSRMKKLEKMELLTRRTEKPKPHFRFLEDRSPSRFVLTGTNLVLGYDVPLTKQVDLKIERGQKIALRGTNGLGKSTLLKTLLGIIPPVAGSVERGEFVSVGYFEQESVKGNQNTALEELWQEYPGMSNSEVRGALAACGLTNDHITTKMTALSGGEAAKVRLCKIMQRPVNLLVLDEPTNHLDVEAKAELQRALQAYKGTLLLVSHEPEFYEGWIDQVWNIEGWSTKIV
ncbi:ABC-F family ATP-binding cassette domain-containing protein [uncultured Acidaminococcus sp.]|uniref:ABC-F family ATP-binding cassette domain-containing protein n=1 Tax=uncultured Acidaminococcus sp. TaxID=352152 RepID=UPI002599C875|nr:ABC-F family ATP-binding cassette domain-containing protein [uncultured Acidaminococcus sp.]